MTAKVTLIEALAAVAATRDGIVQAIDQAGQPMTTAEVTAAFAVANPANAERAADIAHHLHYLHRRGRVRVTYGQYPLRWSTQPDNTHEGE